MFDLTSQILGIESGGNPNARNPNSTATGTGQFIEATWLDMLSKHRPDLTQGKSPQEILALRTDPQLSRDMTEAYAKENGQILSQSGHSATPGNTYLAHFAGPQGAVKVLGAAPDAPVSSILGMKVVNANPFLQNMTAADLRAWADKKMGAPQRAPAQQPADQPPTAPAMPQQQARGFMPQFFGTPGQQQPQGQAPAADQMMQQAQMPDMAAMQMMGLPRRPQPYRFRTRPTSRV